MGEHSHMGWDFPDGTGIHVGKLPHRKQVCVYVVEGAVASVLAYCRDERSADKLREYHAKLAHGEVKQP